MRKTIAFIFFVLANYLCSSQIIVREINHNIPKLFFSDLEIEDFDNDNILDIAICGIPGYEQTPVTKIFKGIGNFEFQEINSDIQGVHHGGIRWIDFDLDADLDLIVFGATISGNPPDQPITLLYENVNNERFELTDYSLMPLMYGDIAVGDMNNDGTPDIVMTGVYNFEYVNYYTTVMDPILTIYYNYPGKGFTKSNYNFRPLSYSSVDLADYDGDGKLDIAASGKNSTVRKTVVYHNEGNDNFTEINQKFIGVAEGNVQWGDMDQDGDPDLLVSGWTAWPDEDEPHGRIYKNENGTFKDFVNLDFGYTYGPEKAKWVDINGDDQLDIFYGNGYFNNLRDTFESHSIRELAIINPENRVMADIPYSDFECKDIDNDGRGDFLIFGLDYARDNTIGKILKSESGIEEVDFGLIPVEYAAQAWADFDHDGAMDILINGASNSSYNSPVSLETRLYQKNQDGEFINFLDTTGTYHGDVEWFDFNNDNYPDFIFSGVDLNGNLKCTIYENMKGQKFELFQQLSGVWYSKICTADLNHDGLQDVVISGCSERDYDGYPKKPETFIYMNTGSKFEKVIHDIPGFHYGDLILADFNNDSYIDLLISGETAVSNQSTSKVNKTVLFLNKDGSFIKGDTTLQGFTRGELSISDIDMNGFQDVVMAQGNDLLIYYNKSGNNFEPFKIESGLKNYNNVNTIDFNNDGKTDLLVSGKHVDYENDISVILLNKGNNSFEKIEDAEILGSPRGELKAIDIDNDMDLDIGFVGGGYAYGWYEDILNTLFFINKQVDGSIGIKNTIPSEPINLQVIESEDHFRLLWEKGVDSETAENALTYNLMVINKTTETLALSPLSDTLTGKRFVVNQGNIGPATFFDFYPTQNGLYEWSVQTIDNSFAGSVFSQKSEFSYEKPLAVEDLKSHFIKIFPNPSTGLFHIELEAENTEETLMEIYNLTGEKIYSNIWKLGESALDLDLSNYSGIAILRLRTKNTLITKKLIIQE